jgi:hypothetical protein
VLTLVGLLASLSGVALDGLGDVVGGVLDRVDGLAEDALIWLVDVWCRHFGIGLVLLGGVECVLLWLMVEVVVVDEEEQKSTKQTFKYPSL